MRALVLIVSVFSLSGCYFELDNFEICNLKITSKSGIYFAEYDGNKIVITDYAAIYYKNQLLLKASGQEYECKGVVK